MKKLWWIALIGVVIIAGGVYTYRVLAQSRSAAASTYQTASVQRGTISSTISAAGTVRSKQSASLNWQTTGVIGDVNVKQGDQVTAGQVLAALNPNDLPPALISAEQSLVNARQALTDLLNNDVNTGTAQQTLANDQQAYNTALANQAGLTAPTRAKADAISAAQAAYDIANLNLQKVIRNYKDTSGNPANSLQKAKALQKLATDQTTLDSAARTLNWDSTPVTAQDKAVAAGNVAAAKAQLDQAQYQWNQLQNGPTASSVAAAQDAVTAAQATVDEAQLTAPFTGTVTSVGILPGDTASPDVQAFRIDDLSSIYVDIQVAEVDINNLQVGQQAQLTFDAVPNKTYKGKITQIGEVGTSTQGVVNFPVTVQITNPDGLVKPGLTAAVNIVVAQHPDVLMVPNRAISLSNGQRSVEVLFEGQVISVPVTVGLTNATLSEVSSSQLKEGDTVIVNPAAVNTNANRGGFGGGFIPGGFIGR
jgi:RND family efflux transporter MFP subunit